MVLKRLKLHHFFDGVARKFSYTQACKITTIFCSITPLGNTVRQHQCGNQARAGWRFCALCILSNIYEILPNSLPSYK